MFRKEKKKPPNKRNKKCNEKRWNKVMKNSNFSSENMIQKKSKKDVSMNEKRIIMCFRFYTWRLFLQKKSLFLIFLMFGISFAFILFVSMLFVAVVVVHRSDLRTVGCCCRPPENNNILLPIQHIEVLLCYRCTISFLIYRLHFINEHKKYIVI